MVVLVVLETPLLLALLKVLTELLEAVMVPIMELVEVVRQLQVLVEALLLLALL